MIFADTILNWQMPAIILNVTSRHEPPLDFSPEKSVFNSTPNLVPFKRPASSTKQEVQYINSFPIPQTLRVGNFALSVQTNATTRNTWKIYRGKLISGYNPSKKRGNICH
ncbi:hypothetical protein CDAR_611771 [Caerostris darwini]|uniref:Uncharacterized protein n=1 Tax=Caerostris darwini TaxID=1538125 RepID=A0AAV4MSB1_9ARAC|nr:hypothetical protein CDAR_611771 [Caerostris darwini]